MGCIQSSAKSPEPPGPREGPSPGRPPPGAPESNGEPPASRGIPGDETASGRISGSLTPTFNVVVNPASTRGQSLVATPTAAEAGAEGPDVVGTDCIPPPGGREGGVLKIGAPPANLMEVPGEPCGHGRVKRGPVSLEGGAVYEGTWKGTVIDGEGSLKAPNGLSYTGHFADGKFEGKGTWVDPKGARYEGEWRAGRVHGKGFLVHEDGSTYTGEFKLDVKDGKGVEKWADGTVFEGFFKDGEKVGKGKIIFPDGSTYEGSFKNDLFDGNGVYVWANQRKYEGCWREGMMSGSGVFTWPTGQFCKYEGQFAKGHKEGKGTLYVRDGRRYSGNFHNNLMDGEVYEVMPSGRRRKGLWEAGVLQRWLDEAQKVNLVIEEKDDDKDAEFQTSIFSNPDAYTQVYKVKDRKRMKVKGGLLRGKAETDAPDSPEPEEHSR